MLFDRYIVTDLMEINVANGADRNGTYSAEVKYFILHNTRDSFHSTKIRVVHQNTDLLEF